MVAIASHLPSGLTGVSMIGGKNVTSSGRTFQKTSPIDLAVLGDITLATEEQIEEALVQAWQAYWQNTVNKPSNRLRRAEMLEKVADKLEQRREHLRIVYGLESGLPSVKAPEGAPLCRFDVEFNRTVAQLRFHAKRLKDHTHFVPVINTGTAFGKIGKTMRGIGPILLLGAINFPLAFSTAGGDFADAWASGCSVIMKAHAQHPFTSEIVAQCISSALEELGEHQGWFSLIHCERELTQKMVADDRIKAIAITGSLDAARSIKEVADKCNKPVFAECGSINPIFVLPEVLKTSPKKFAVELVTSVTGSAGQFCTCPGLVVLLEGIGYDECVTEVANLINAKPAATMLSERTKRDFVRNVQKLLEIPGMSVLAGGQEVDHATQSKPVILTISAADFLKSPEACQLEAFGHETIIVKASNIGQVYAIATALSGNLTATIYATEFELLLTECMKLRGILSTKAGRQIANGMPTGVAVVNAMCHGGPFPACTIFASSVGGSLRFMVEVCYQNAPDASLPEELRSSTTGIMRLVNGSYSDVELSA